MIRRPAAALALAVLLVAGCGSDSGDEATSEASGFAYGSGECPPEEKPAKRPESFDDAPRRCLEDDVDYGAVVTTSEGTFTIDLLEEEAPGAVNNFVVLARWGWFDGNDVHRVVRGFMNQTGDPVGQPTGTGDPGYTIPDELPASLAEYRPGTVAMANRGADTSGSQWFACVDCSGLPSPDYTIFGQVVEGQDVVQAINAFGVGNGPPSRPIAIETVEITEG